MMEAIAVVVAVLAIAQITMNAMITIRVLKSDYYETFQKGAQIAIVWLVPVAGLILVWGLLHHNGPRREIEGESDDEDDDVEESLFADHGSAAPQATDMPVVDAPAGD